MKKVLMVLGVVFLAVVVGFLALLLWANKTGSAMQGQFFTAVLSGDPAQVTAMFDPAMKDEVDEPVLAAWMDAVRENLGGYQGLSKTHFNTSTRYENGSTITQSTGTVNFEKGQAQAELVFRDKQIVKFFVKSDKLPVAWFTGPTQTELYRARGKEFLTRFLSNQPDAAFQMMHPALQKQMPLEELGKTTAAASAKGGALQSITYDSETYDPKKQTLLVRYALKCENVASAPFVKFEFVGLKGHLVAYSLTGEAL